MDDFTLKLPIQKHKKIILFKCVLSMLRLGEKQKTNSALTSS